MLRRMCTGVTTIKNEYVWAGSAGVGGVYCGDIQVETVQT